MMVTSVSTKAMAIASQAKVPSLVKMLEESLSRNS